MAALASLLAVGGGASAAPARGEFGEPPDSQYPLCTAEIVTYCIISVETKAPGADSFGPMPSGFVPDFASGTEGVWAVRGSFSDARPYGELAPDIPVGSSIRYVVNTGDLESPGHMWAFARVDEWTSTFDAATGWTHALEYRTIARTQGGTECGGCPPEDFASQGSLQLADLDAVQEEPVLSAYDRSIVSGNANLAPTFFDNDTQTINWWLFGPPVTEAGQPNEGWIEAFVPDAMLQLYFGVDGASLPISAVVVTAGESGAGTPVAATVERLPGGVRISVSGFVIADQATARGSDETRFSLKARRALGAPENVAAGGRVRRVVMNGDAVARARSYQALCYRGSRQVYAESEGSRVVVRGLRAGRWNCQLRAVRVTGGYWSDPIEVRVRRPR